MDARIQEVFELLIEQTRGALPTRSVLSEECRRLWRRLATRESEAAIEQWRQHPRHHAAEIQGALQRLIADESFGLDRLVFAAAAEGARPASTAAPQEPSSPGSVAINIGSSEHSVVAGHDVKMAPEHLKNPPKLPPGIFAPRKPMSSDAPPVAEAEGSLKILFLGANPDDSTRLRLDQEVRAIDRALRLSEHGHRVDLEQQWAVQVGDLQDCLHRHRPVVIHFSGHGSVESLHFENASGRAHPVPGSRLEKLFGMFREHVRCVVLNCCHSAEQASAIARVVDCVVGMATSVGDQAAIHFAVGFYRGLTSGRSVQAAFDHGCLEVELFEPAQGDVPKLTCPRMDPARIVLLPARAGTDGSV